MNTDIQLSLTEQEAQLVMDALVQLPFHVVANLVQKIQQQAQACLAARGETHAEL